MILGTEGKREKLYAYIFPQSQNMIYILLYVKKLNITKSTLHSKLRGQTKFMYKISTSKVVPL